MMRFLIALGLGVAAALPVSGQTPERCPNGTAPVGDYGLADVDANILVSEDNPATPGATRVRFGSELLVRAMHPGSAGYGMLRPHDIIVSLDGHLVTTFEGSRLITRPPIGRPVTIVVRRQTEEKAVRVVPRASCTTLFGPGLPSARRVNTTLPPGTYRRVGTGTGWIGLQFECSQCETERDVHAMMLLASARPRVLAIAPGSPAAVAGARVGDVLVGVDDHSVPGVAAHLRLGSIMAGERIRLRMLRGDDVVELNVTAGRVPGAR